MNLRELRKSLPSDAELSRAPLASRHAAIAYALDQVLCGFEAAATDPPDWQAHQLGCAIGALAAGRHFLAHACLVVALDPTGHTGRDAGDTPIDLLPLEQLREALNFAGGRAFPDP